MHRFQTRITMLLIAVIASSAFNAAASAGVNWRTNLDAAKVEAAQTNRFVLLHFWSPTCGPCKQLDQTVFSQPEIGPAVEKNYVPVKINADAWPAISQAFRITQVPTEVILSPQGNVLTQPQIPRTADQYVAQLDRLATHFKQTAQRTPTTTNVHTVNTAYQALPIAAIGQTNAGAAAANQVTPAAATTPNASSPISGHGQLAAAQLAGAQVTQPTPPQASQNPYATGSNIAHGLNGATAIANQNTVANQAAAPGPRYSAAPTATQVNGSLVATNAGVAANPYATSTGNPSSASPIAQQTPASVVQTGATMQSSVTNGAAHQTATMRQQAVTPTPVSASSLGLDGYCPVSLRFAQKWVKGSDRIGVVHRGRTYLFAGEKERQQFLSDPDRYSPVFNGLDPVIAIDEHRAVEGSRRFGFEHRGAIYLFSSKETMDKFGSDSTTADAYAARVHEAMMRIDGGNATIRR